MSSDSQRVFLDRPWDLEQYASAPGPGGDEWSYRSTDHATWLIRTHSTARRRLYNPHDHLTLEDLEPVRVTVQFVNGVRRVIVNNWTEQSRTVGAPWTGYTLACLKLEEPLASAADPIAGSTQDDVDFDDVAVHVGRHYHVESGVKPMQESGPRPSTANGTLGCIFLHGHSMKTWSSPPPSSSTDSAAVGGVEPAPSGHHPRENHWDMAEGVEV